MKILASLGVLVAFCLPLLVSAQAFDPGGPGSGSGFGGGSVPGAGTGGIISSSEPGGGSSGGVFSISNPLRAGSLEEFLVALLDIVITITFPIIVLAIIWTGFLFVSAGGNEGKLTKAKEMLMYSLIGAALVLGAKVLAVAIQGTIEQIVR